MALKVSEIEEAIYQTRGNLSAVARGFAVSRQAIQKRVNNSERLQKALEDARENMLDAAENVLYEKALQGETAELIFFLKTQGKRRGYTEKQEVEHSGGVVIQLEWGDNDTDTD